MNGVVTINESFVTALSSDDYLPGVLVLGKTIRETCVHSLFVLASRGLAAATYETLQRSGIPYCTADDIVVNTTDDVVINTADDVPASSAQRLSCDPVYSHWPNTLFKLRVFEQTQFDKIVFIDSDIMVLESLDDLFELSDMSAAIAGKSYPGNGDWRELNSGVLVIVPRGGSADRIAALAPAVAAEKQDFGDQDVLAAYLPGWPEEKHLHLPEECNVFFDHYHFYKKHGGVKAVHFIGRKKPWMLKRRDIPAQLIRCIVKGNAGGARILLRCRRYLKEVGACG